MKQWLLMITFCSMFSSIWASKISTVDTGAITVETKPTFVAIPNNNTLKQLLGRKLTLKEKLALLFVKTTNKKGIPADAIEAKKANNTAVLGFVFSVLGYFIFPLLIPGYILSNNVLKKEKANPELLTDTNKTLAQIGKIFPIVYIVLVVIVLFLIFALLAGFR